MGKINKTKKVASAIATAIVSIPLMASFSLAAMPWEGALTQIKESITGDTARSIVTLGICAAGLMYSAGEQGGFFRKAAGVVGGGCIALGAATVTGMLGG